MTKKEVAQSIATEISRIVYIKSAFVDDYNRYGSFQVVAYLETDRFNRPLSSKFSMQKIRAEIKSILKKNNQVSKFGMSIETPKREYYRYYGECSFQGYDRNYIMIDFTVVLEEEQIPIQELLT